MIGEAVNGRQSRVSMEQQCAMDGITSGRANRFRADTAYLAFLETYISRLEAPIAVQVWNTLFGFARDLLSSASTPTAKAQVYPVLRYRAAR
jgi:hypothetical protein